MHHLLVAVLIACTPPIQNPVKPQILSLRFGLAARDFTGQAAGWPFRAHRWNWLSAVVVNPFDRDITAQLVFHASQPNATGQFQLSRTFHLPANASRTCSFPIQAAFAGPAAAQTFGVLELKIDGQVVDEKRSSISPLEASVHPVAILGDHPGLRFAVDAKSLYPTRGPQLEPRGNIRTLRLRDGELPDHPLGLDFLRTIILVEPHRHELSTAQWQAIDGWIQAGGNLIVTFEDTAPHSAPILQRLLPASPMGVRRATILSSLTAWSGEPLKHESGFVIHEMQVRSGQPLVWEGSIPLVVWSPHGMGSVTCVAVAAADSLANLTAYQAFWLEVLRRVQRPALVDTARLEANISPVIEQFAGRHIAGIWLPLSITAGYCLIAGGLARRAFRQGAGERAWPAICLAAILFAALSLTIGWVASPHTIREVYDVWVATGASRSERLRINDFRAFVPAERGPSTVRVTEPQVLAVPAAEYGASVVQAAMEPDGVAIHFQGEKAKRQIVALDGFIPHTGPHVSAAAEPGGVVVTCRNTTEQSLEQCFFMLGRRLVAMAGVNPGEERSVMIGPATQATELDQFGQGEDSAGRLRQSMLETLFVDPASLADSELLVQSFRGSEQGTRSKSFFGGWLQRALDVTWDEDREPTRYRGLGLVAIEPEWESPRQTFLVPKGAMQLLLREPGWWLYYYGKSVFRGDHPFSTPLGIEFALPQWGGPARIEQATLFIQFHSEAYKLRVFVGDERLAIPDAPSGKYAIPIDGSGAAARGSIALRVMVEPSDAFAQNRAWEGYRWTLNEFDVECQATPLDRADGKPKTTGRGE